MNLRRLRAVALLLALAAGSAWAQDVALTGVSSGRALLVIDGAAPRFFVAGDQRAGIKVLSVGADSAVVEVAGQRRELRLGQSPFNFEAGNSRDSSRIVLQADGAGHFFTPGQINGKTVQFIVDTGATVVILSQADATRIGLRADTGRPVQMTTANGTVRGHQVLLSSVRVGSAQVYDVPGVVMPQPMPFVLLGNSFLSRFQMQRTNDQMVLEKRF